MLRPHGQLRRLIEDNFLYDTVHQKLLDDESFVEKGIMDSTGIVELIGLLEAQFQIKLEDRDLVPENLDSINNLASFIQRKLGNGEQPVLTSALERSGEPACK